MPHWEAHIRQEHDAPPHFTARAPIKRDNRRCRIASISSTRYCAVVYACIGAQTCTIRADRDSSRYACEAKAETIAGNCAIKSASRSAFLMLPVEMRSSLYGRCVNRNELTKSASLVTTTRCSRWEMALISASL